MAYYPMKVICSSLITAEKQMYSFQTPLFSVGLFNLVFLTESTKCFVTVPLKICVFTSWLFLQDNMIHK